MTDHPPKDFMFAPHIFIYVYRLPETLTDGFCFGGGRPISFLNVDWFETIASDGRAPLIMFIKAKRYYIAKARYLVLSDHPDFTFTIEKETANGFL